MRTHDVDTETARRLEVVDALLPVLARLVDVRKDFAHLAAIVHRVLPHDAMGVSLISADATYLHGFAFTGDPRPDAIPERIPPIERRDVGLASHGRIVRDARAAEPESAIARLGYRSLLRVPIRIRGQAVAALSVLRFAPGQYRDGDLLVAKIIAGLLGLVLPQALRQLPAADLGDSPVDAKLGMHDPGPVGRSAAWRAVLLQADQVAKSDTTVLLLGESGSGKEVLARYVHQQSARRGGPFVAVNCAALPEPLVESELFGAERGAFTGALQTKVGRIEAAARGTLFLDEVAELSLAAQAKLLRVLELRAFERLGSTRAQRADVRIIAATNRDLLGQIAQGTFREDLYYRLDVFGIHCPPLRTRPEDILPLAEHFIRTLGRTLNRDRLEMSGEARRALLEYEWPGNVRQLRNVVERALILCVDGLIRCEHLGLDRTGASTSPLARLQALASVSPASIVTPAHGVDLRSLERSAIERALRDAGNNKSQAARVLGLTRRELYGRLRRHGLSV